MLLSDLSIKRPVTAAVAMLALVTLGIFSYRRLAIDQFPKIDIPVVSIVTKFPGASPEAVEREVTKKVEEAVNPIAGVKHVSSFSRESLSTIVVEFNLEVKINDAAQDCRTKIGSIRGQLPDGIEEPIIDKLDFAAMPIISLAVRSETLIPRELTLLVDRAIRPRLENISGVGKVQRVGETKREIGVQIDPARIEALGLGVDEVVAGLAAENVNTPLGRLTRGTSETTLRVAGKPVNAEEFALMVIAQRGDRPVTLGDVARISDGVEERRSLALLNGTPAIGIDILKQSGANTVEVVDTVKKVADDLSRGLPPGVSLEVVRDGSTFIRESVADVQETLIIGAILTVLIVFIFLNSWRSTVITGLTLPIAVISSFSVMNFMGMTLNMLTLMALSLAIGMLIDDAIVVRENIVRHLEQGKDHFTAAREATSEIGLAVLATTMSVVAVFVPVAFMKGIIGRFFYEFGITVAFAVLVSLLVSFTLDPMLSSRWYDPAVANKGHRRGLAKLLEHFDRWFEATAEHYRRIIAWALDHRLALIGMAVGAFALGLFIFSRLESTFMQSYDRGEFQILFKSAPDASIAETEGRLKAVLAMLGEFPEVEHTYSTIGAGDTGTVRDASVYVELKARKQRTRDQFAIMSLVRRKLAEIPGIRSAIYEAGMVGGGEKQLTLNIRGEDIGQLKRYGAQLKEKVAAIPGIVDLEMTLEEEVPEYRLTVDRRKAADLGLNTGAVVRTVGALVGGRVVTTYEDELGDAVDVRVRLPRELRGDPYQVERLRITARRPDGTTSLVSLGEIAATTQSTAPAEIDRLDLSRQVVLGANLDGTQLGTAQAKALAATKEISMDPGYNIVFSGEAERMGESFGYLGESLLMAVLFVYLILAAQFESFVLPFSIMLSLPLSLVGLAGALLITRDTISIMSLIGLIMLMGLVTKNAILLVDYARTLRARGMARREALIEAGRTRLRPIMMTTLAMIFGMLPLALGLGAGGEMRAPLARGVIGGLITSTALTLLVVPVAYTLLDDLGGWLLRKWRGSEEAHP